MNDEIVEDRAAGHLDDEALDRLRAGLVGDADAHRQVELHLASCPLCQKRAGRWDQVGSVLRKEALPRGVEAELRMRRRAALTASPARRWPTLVAAAGAAVLVLGIGLATQLSERSSPRNPAPVREDAPDLYAEIDFYLWLSQQEEKMGREERSGRNS